MRLFFTPEIPLFTEKHPCILATIGSAIVGYISNLIFNRYNKLCLQDKRMCRAWKAKIHLLMHHHLQPRVQASSSVCDWNHMEAICNVLNGHKSFTDDVLSPKWGYQHNGKELLIYPEKYIHD